jgi:cystathionine beta-lyase family protein involved in aluminum resistance
MAFSADLLSLAAEAEAALGGHFARIDGTSFELTSRVLSAFSEFRVSDSCFGSSTGYGYGDRGREILDSVWARVFGTEAALVRHNFVNGTHAISTALFGLLRPGDTLLSATGRPYDTLDGVIGAGGATGEGSLRDFGVSYAGIELAGGRIDVPAVIGRVISDPSVKVVYIQRSKGYLGRRTLTAAEITEACSAVRAARPGVFTVVDNCYGEFCDGSEPSADLLCGSLIKNPGGGMALTGGYLAGTAEAVRLASYRLTTVGTGGEVGATLGQNMNMFKGLYYAPHSVANALKTAHLAAYVFGKLGYAVSPGWDEPRSDIIQTVATGSPEKLRAFCGGIQAGSPVDSFAEPEPWAMPGYADEVIMAAGCFVQGASLELSADGPLRPPYTVFFQGGLTYESGKYGILTAASRVGPA